MFPTRIFLLSSILLIAFRSTLAGSLEFRYSYGFTLAHRKVMVHYYERHYGIYEVAHVWGGKKFSPWRKEFHFPKTGLGCIYSSMGQTRLIGSSFALYPFLSVERGKNVKWYFRVGSGLGYISRPFNRETNYKNIAIGSHLNAFIRIEQGMTFRLGKRCMMGTGISLSHFSNAATKTPNLGVNVVTANAFLRWNYKQDVFRDSTGESYKIPLWCILPSAGFREVYPAGGPKYGVWNSSVQRNFGFRSKGNFFAGVDLFYSPSLRRELGQDNNPDNDNNALLQCGIHTGFQFVFNRFSIPVLMGVYAIDKVKRNGLTYQSVALRYHIKKHWFAQVTLKSHKAKAEYATYGIGYSL